MNTQTLQMLKRGALAGMGGGAVMAMWSMMFGAATALLTGTGPVRHGHRVPHLHGTPA